MLTDHPPFAGGTTYETIRLLLNTEPRQPRLWNRKIDRDLSTICLKCLEKDPKRRYSSALTLAEDLEHWLKHEPIVARRTGLFTRGRKWVRRNPSTAVLITLLVALAALVSPRVVRNNHFDARVVVRQCRRASYHQKCTGIVGSRGVRFSSPTELDIDDWCGCNL